MMHSKEEIQFIEKYAKKLHHIRHYNNFNFKHTKVNELLFTREQKHNGKDNFLFMGDSWFEQLIFYEGSKKRINDYFNKKKISYTNAAISSYSPTLHTLQYKILKDDFKLNPNYLIIYVDQIDFGDEVCRYKKNRYFDKNSGKLKGVKDPFNLTRTSVFYDIANSNSHYLIKDLRMFNFLINEKIRIVKNRIRRIFGSDINLYGCNVSKIFNNLINPTNEEIQYFQDSIDLMLNTLTKDNNIKKILVVTFPHRNNIKNIENFSIKKDRVSKEMLKLDIFKENKDSKKFIVKDFVINVADFVNVYISKSSNKKVKHLDFTKKNNSGKIEINNKVYTKGDPTAHLNHNGHLNVFTRGIVEEIDNLLNTYE